MLSDAIFKKTNAPAMGKMLDAAMLRMRAISNNIANVNTPGYRRAEVSFEKELRTALDRTRLQGAKTDDQHFALGRLNVSEVNPKAYTPIDPSQPSGVNNVDIDMEMAKLAETQIMFNYGVKFNASVYKKINAAIQGRSIPLQ